MVSLLPKRAVIGESVQLIVLARRADLGHHDLNLEGLAIGSEDRAKRLRVGVGQSSHRDIRPVIGVSAHVGITNTRDPQRFELVILTHGCERDSIVDLADLVQCSRRILSREQDAIVVSDDDNRTAPRYALACIVGPILHELFGRDVKRSAHVCASPAAVPRASARLAISPSLMRRYPAESTTATTG